MSQLRDALDQSADRGNAFPGSGREVQQQFFHTESRELTV